MIRTSIDGNQVEFLCDEEHEANVVVGMIDRAKFRFRLEEFRVRQRTGKVPGIAGVVVRLTIIGEGEIERLTTMVTSGAAE